ncbi:hypothetical protein [Porphyrobacter sp. GA68]|uniref:hypothetical protein n=1 Tax=Porphyrobacter sp. GA68 TaxID=2883480 RepID=UPI001D1854EF|nr:hypothetical protein [Porphyrobacter sp. GA68]
MKKIIAVALAGGALLGLSACDVDQTQEGELPTVDVQGGQLPEYDVRPAEVEVQTGTTQVEVPTVDVDVRQPDAAGTPATGRTE